MAAYHALAKSLGFGAIGLWLLPVASPASTLPLPSPAQEAHVTQTQSPHGWVTIIRTGEGHSEQILQTGTDDVVRLEQHGSGHSAVSVQAGEASRLVINQSGRSAKAHVAQSGSGNSATITQSGNSNRVVVTQGGKPLEGTSK